MVRQAYLEIPRPRQKCRRFSAPASRKYGHLRPARRLNRDPSVCYLSIVRSMRVWGGIMNRSFPLALVLFAAGCVGPKDVTEVSLPQPVKGFQYKIDPFAVASGQEVQACYFFKIPGAATDEF